MQNGRYYALLNVLDKLGNDLNSSACLLVDERGLLISEYIATDIDKNGIAVMSSLLDGTSSRFIDSLNLDKLQSLFINTSKGSFLIKQILIPNQNRKFVISVFIERKNGMVKNYKRTIRKGVKDYILKLFGARRIERKGSNKAILIKVNQTIKKIQEIFNK